MIDLTLDIETAPTQDASTLKRIETSIREEYEAKIAAAVAPDNYKDADKIKAYVAKRKDALAAERDAAIKVVSDKSALDGGAGQVCAISMLVDAMLCGGPVSSRDYKEAIRPELSINMVVHDLSRESERSLLIAFALAVENVIQRCGAGPVRIVGHNVVGFDLPFLAQRAAVRRVKLPDALPRRPQPWDQGVFDTQYEWAGRNGYVSLDTLCGILGVENEDQVSGRDIASFARAGDFETIREHCRMDVLAAYRCARIMQGDFDVPGGDLFARPSEESRNV